MRNRKPEFQYSWKMSRLTRIFPLLFVSLSPYKHFLLHWTPNSSSFSSLLFAMSEDPFPGSLYVTMYARKMGAFPPQQNRSDSRLNMLCKQQQPNQQRTLNKFLTELRCRKFCQEAPTEHTNRAPNVQKHVCNVYVFQLSFHFAHLRWWLGTHCSENRLCNL